MVVGLISDTHGLLRPEVFEAFRDVGHIIHAGDIGEPEILTELEALAPVTAVWGNTDAWRIRELVSERAEVELGGVNVQVVHGQQFGVPNARVLAEAHPAAGLIVFGHSHRPEIERVGPVLAVNPGSAGPARFDLPVTVALATCESGKASAQLVHLIGR